MIVGRLRRGPRQLERLRSLPSADAGPRDDGGARLAAGAPRLLEGVRDARDGAVQAMRLVLEAAGMPVRRGLQLLPPVPRGRAEVQEEDQGRPIKRRYVNTALIVNMLYNRDILHV